MCDFDWFCLRVLISILNWSWRVIPNIPFSIKYSRSQYITNIPSMSIWTKDYTFLFEFLKTRHNGRWPEPHGPLLIHQSKSHFLVPNWVWQIEGVVPDKHLDWDFSTCQKTHSAWVTRWSTTTTTTTTTTATTTTTTTTTMVGILNAKSVVKHQTLIFSL